MCQWLRLCPARFLRHRGGCALLKCPGKDPSSRDGMDRVPYRVATKSPSPGPGPPPTWLLPLPLEEQPAPLLWSSQLLMHLGSPLSHMHELSTLLPRRTVPHVRSPPGSEGSQAQACTCVRQASAHSTSIRLCWHSLDRTYRVTSWLDHSSRSAHSACVAGTPARTGDKGDPGAGQRELGSRLAWGGQCGCCQMASTNIPHYIPIPQALKA